MNYQMFQSLLKVTLVKNGLLKIQTENMAVCSTLKEALANSVNVISANLIKQFRPQPVVDLVKKWA